MNDRRVVDIKRSRRTAGAATGCAILVSVFTVLALSAAAASGDTIRVPDDQPTIQAGISKAAPGDTVLVTRGGPYASIALGGKSITVSSTHLAASEADQRPVIQGGAGTRAVTIVNGGANRIVLAGFTVRGGDLASASNNGAAICPRWGGGILCQGSSPRIECNTITGNAAWRGGGIYCGDGASPIIQHNIITGNHANSDIISAPSAGGGICCENESFPVIYDNQIVGNDADWPAYEYADDAQGAGIYCGSASSVSILGNLIEANRFHRAGRGYGGGICCQGSLSADIRGNRIISNYAHIGGGVCCRDDAFVNIDNDTIVGNYSEQGGGVWFAYTPRYQPYPPNPARARVVVQNCIIAFSGKGVGLFLGCGVSQVVRYCDVYMNPGDMDDNSSLARTIIGVNGNIAADPLFVDRANGDLRLRSEYGRWDGRTWVLDTVTSPCVGAGAPYSRYGGPDPNGRPANLGYDGNTDTASKPKADARR